MIDAKTNNNLRIRNWRGFRTSPYFYEAPMKTKFAYEKIRFDRVSQGKNKCRFKIIETEGFLVKDSPLDYIELVVHRAPTRRDTWIVSERNSGYRVGGVESQKTKNHAVILAVGVVSGLGQDYVEHCIEEKRQWKEYYKTRVPYVSVEEDRKLTRS